MPNPILEPRLAFTHFSEEQRRALADARGRIEALLSGALDTFYETAEGTPETNLFFRDRTHMGRAKSAQEAHWRRIASARFDDEYLDSVRRIGATHARIGLEPRWYVGAYAIVIEGLIRGLSATAGRQRFRWRVGTPDESLTETLIAVVKAAMIDMELSISMYIEQSQAERDRAAAALERREADLRHLLESVGRSADTVLVGAREIAQASEDLARRTESNAASLEETSAAVAQMDARLHATAASATKTVGRADQAIASVSSGRVVADDAVQAMGRVRDSAKGIDNVIEGLDKIAFQTRVLAMNAAVEAGRAGEAGRGFAVVADLVSALAMRAEEEAKLARDQLTATQADVGVAVQAVEKVDAVLDDIAATVGEVHQLLAAMASDNKAQANAVSEISAATASMDRATQENAAMVEETSAAARNLLGEANLLHEQASRSPVAAVEKEAGQSRVAA